MSDAVTDRTLAVRYYNAGHPSTLPDSNPYKYKVERHRWGYHADAVVGCPVCDGVKAYDSPLIRMLAPHLVEMS